MKLTNELKDKIDGMTYKELLSKWRFAPLGDELMLGESGKYFSKVFRVKENAISHSEHTRISKEMGW